MTDTKRYKITLVVEGDPIACQWIADAINGSLGGKKELVDWEAEEVSDDFELLSSINDVPN